MADNSAPPTSLMRCIQCRGLLQPSGQEPHRFVCEKCGQNYLAVFQLVAVEPARRPLLGEPERGDVG